MHKFDCAEETFVMKKNKKSKIEADDLKGVTGGAMLPIAPGQPGKIGLPVATPGSTPTRPAPGSRLP